MTALFTIVSLLTHNGHLGNIYEINRIMNAICAEQYHIVNVGVIFPTSIYPNWMVQPHGIKLPLDNDLSPPKKHSYLVLWNVRKSAGGFGGKYSYS